ncbi:MAG TPA: 30S ribosomal protein S17 [Patescibacteria group bacterium]|nr:30S ribosomal protein S17 [Patescibacteria group bacterium]
MKKQKGFIGNVISTGMKDTVVVEVERKVRHPLYRKEVKRTKHFSVDSGGKQVSVGDVVQIIETRPMSKTKHFKLV